MLKKLASGVAIASVALIVAGVTMVRVEVRQASRRPAADAEQPRMLKKTELFTQGRAADVVDIMQVWAAYGFYNDSGNGEGVASLFTEDGILRHYWNDKGTKWEPHGGIGDFKTAYGTTRGGPCVLRGRKEIQQYFGGERPATPWPGWTHHTFPNQMVKLNDDGKTAVLTTTMVIASTSEKGEGRLTTGMYRVLFRKTPEGWLIAEQNNLADRSRNGSKCDANGNLPRATR